MKTELTLAQAQEMECARDLLSHCRQFNPDAEHEALLMYVNAALECVGVDLRVIHDSSPLIAEVFEQEGVS